MKMSLKEWYTEQTEDFRKTHCLYRKTWYWENKVNDVVETRKCTKCKRRVGLEIRSKSG